MTRILATATLLLAGPAPAREVAGVKVSDTVEVGGRTLALNGAGVRKKFIVRVYVGALYLAAPASDPAAILSADAPWAVRMHFLRDVGQKSILGAFRDGFENNSKEKLAQLAPLLDRLAPAIPDIQEGQVLAVTYQPGAGVTVGVDAGARVTVEGKDFADALLLNWLGPDPADSGLKEKMLGR